jgi:hypothetical protein
MIFVRHSDDSLLEFNEVWKISVLFDQGPLTQSKSAVL